MIGGIKMNEGGLEMKLLLIGPQGSGKGTQGKKLAEEYGWQTVVSGDMIRSRMNTDKSFAEKFSSVNQGNLIPDQEIAEMIRKRIKEPDCEKGYIIDGFPRTLWQAEILDEMIDLDYAILIDVPDEESIERLSSRWQCKGCNKIYGLNEAPPKNGKCSCGGEVYQREDDKPEAIKRRLNLYHKETEPILGYYEKQDKLLRIDGLGKEEEVYARIKEALEK